MLVARSASRGASSAGESPARPAPSVQRQIDQLERHGAVAPTERRRLQDLLRREPRGPERSAAGRRLERLPDDAPAASPAVPDEPATFSLPSSARPGSGGRRGRGPGTSGYTVPPGGRSSEVR